MKQNEEIYIVTDACMWEQNKKNSTFNPHAIEVVNIKTGQIRFIFSGSRITFVEGEITDISTQQVYNQGISEMPSDREDKLQGTESKRSSNKKDKSVTKN